MNIKSIYLNKPFWKTVIPLALPIAVQNLLAASFAMVDTFMVAGLGDTVLSSVGMASQFSWLMNAFIFGLASGTALFVSQYWGTDDRASIHKTQGMALIMSLSVSLIFCLTAFFASPLIVRIYSKTPEVISLGSSYLKFVCWSYIPNALTFTLSTVLRSTEKVKLPVLIAVITALLNMSFNYCLIYGNFGFPKMGAAGAALATSLSNWISFIVLLIISVVKKNILIAPLSELFGFSARDFKNFLKKAVPIVCNEATWAVGTVTMNAILSNLGDEYYAGVTILRTVENLAFVFIVGLCNACSIIVGKQIGAGKVREAKENTVRFSFIMPLFSILTSSVLLLLRHPIVGLFTSNGEYSALSISTAIMCITTYACIMPFRNMPYLYIVGVFRPGGDPKTGLLCDMIPLWIISIPTTAILAYVVKLPFHLVFMFMYLCEDIPKATLCICYYLTGKWVRPVTEEGKLALKKMKAEKQSHL